VLRSRACDLGTTAQFSKPKIPLFWSRRLGIHSVPIRNGCLFRIWIACERHPTWSILQWCRKSLMYGQPVRISGVRLYRFGAHDTSQTWKRDMRWRRNWRLRVRKMCSIHRLRAFTRFLLSFCANVRFETEVKMDCLNKCRKRLPRDSTRIQRRMRISRASS
jgi:hypothetical protein